MSYHGVCDKRPRETSHWTMANSALQTLAKTGVLLFVRFIFLFILLHFARRLGATGEKFLRELANRSRILFSAFTCHCVASCWSLYLSVPFCFFAILVFQFDTFRNVPRMPRGESERVDLFVVSAPRDPLVCRNNVVMIGTKSDVMRMIASRVWDWDLILGEKQWCDWPNGLVVF